MGGQHEPDLHFLEQTAQRFSFETLALETRERARQGGPLGRILGRRLVLTSASDPVVALGDVHQLEIDRERAHYPPELTDAHGVYPPPELCIQLRVVVEAQALA
jgi:hypothetical protein